MKTKFRNKIYLPIKRFFQWLLKVFQYSILLWNDRDYDYNFIFKILCYKISRTRKQIEKNNLFVGCSEVVEDMKKAEFLLDKIINDSFAEDLYKSHNDKWGKTEMIFESLKDKSEYNTLTFKAEKAITKEQQKKERKEFSEINKKAEEEKNKTMDELFSLLRNKIEYWWD